MDYDYSNLVELAKRWGEEALQAGWINDKDYKQLNSFDSRTPDSLFAMDVRPLIVAFFGGTGVGKSTLLNRLAGKAIAKTGVERPTSKEVTLYHHQQVLLQRLPRNLPVDKIKLVAHNDESRKNIIWIDMPDMDSTELQNRQLVLEWLPHIDVLIYVVSPERYRDNKAWRMLLAEGGRHAWIFVLNQWDKGKPEQYDDFIQQLQKAGFENPIVMRTVCAAGQADNQMDEFTKLDETVQSLTDKHTIEQLEIRGIQARKDELKQRLESCLHKLGEEQSSQALYESWEKNWQEAVASLEKGFAWPLQQMASVYTDKEAHLLTGLFKKKDAAVLTSALKPAREKIWDDWSQSRYDDALDKVILQADGNRLPIMPLRNSFSSVRNKAEKIIHNQTELAVRQALANPGNKLQRFFLKLSSLSATLFPLTAMSWVGYQVFLGFYNSSISQKAYLGVDFAVHSILLILISWMLPYFIKRQLKPSMEKVALKGLKRGLMVGLETINAEVMQAITDTNDQRQHYVEKALTIIKGCSDPMQSGEIKDDATLSRMLIDS
jgi:GTPase Era involved in 16S rRNA processing